MSGRYDENGEWVDDAEDNPYMYADYTTPNNTPTPQDDPWHSYNPQTEQESTGNSNAPFAAPASSSNNNNQSTDDKYHTDQSAFSDPNHAQAWLDELGKRYGTGVGETDKANLMGKNPEDFELFQKQLEAQYKTRGSNDPHPGSSGASSGSPGQQIVSSWNGGSPSAPGNSGLDALTALLKQQFEAQQKDAAERKARADSLFATYDQRAKQALTVDKNDPIVRQQADAFSANQQRAGREHLADMAEASGPTANLLGEERLTSERVGQSTGEFEAQLVGRELQSKRDEIANALASMGNMLSGDQQAALQQQLSLIDNQLRSQLGNRGLDTDWSKALLNNDQFLANLGFQTSDRNNYYDLVRRGYFR